MMRRDLINLALAVVLVPATVGIVIATMTRSPKALAFPRPTHRVAMAVDEALRAELATVERGDGQFDVNGEIVDKLGREYFVAGDPKLPEDFPAFWLSYNVPFETPPLPPGEIESKLIDLKTANCLLVYNSAQYHYYLPPRETANIFPVTLDELEFKGQDRDGREVKVTVKRDPYGEGTVVDFHENNRLPRLIAGRVWDRLAHPLFEQESPEDRTALMAFFKSAPYPGGIRWASGMRTPMSRAPGRGASNGVLTPASANGSNLTNGSR